MTRSFGTNRRWFALTAAILFAGAWTPLTTAQQTSGVVPPPTLNPRPIPTPVQNPPVSKPIPTPEPRPPLPPPLPPPAPTPPPPTTPVNPPKPPVNPPPSTQPIYPVYPQYPSNNYFNLYDGGDLNFGNGPVNNNPPPALPVAPLVPDVPALPPPPDSTSISAQVENAVNASPEMVAANQAVRKAQTVLDLAKASVLDGLKKGADYQKALQSRTEAEQQLDAAKVNSSDPESLTALARTKLHAGDEVTRMEEKAIAADPAAAAAKKDLDDSIAKRDALHAKLAAKFQAGGA